MTWTKQTSYIAQHEYVPHYEQFELKLGMCGEEGLLTNFSEFHGDRTSGTVFAVLSQNLPNRPCS